MRSAYSTDTLERDGLCWWGVYITQDTLEKDGIHQWYSTDALERNGLLQWVVYTADTAGCMSRTEETELQQEFLTPLRIVYNFNLVNYLLLRSFI